MKKDHVMMPYSLITGLAMPMHNITEASTHHTANMLFTVMWQGKINHLTERASVCGIQLQCVGQNDANNKKLLLR